MKINLECGNNTILGYRNLELKPSSKFAEYGNFRNLSQNNILDNSVDEIRIGNCLRKMNMFEAPQIFEHWKSKLKTGGRIYIIGVDADILGNNIAHHHIGIDEINQILFGTNQDESMRGLFSLSTMKIFLNRIGFRIIECGYNGTMFHIEAEKIS
jgi:hypothetical protein